MIVEDDTDFAASLELALDIIGLSVMIAGSAEAAYEIMEANHGNISLVFFDIKLPQEDGLSCYEKIRTKHPGVTGIVMTGFRDEKILARARSVGAVEVLLKPFRLADFMALAKKHTT